MVKFVRSFVGSVTASLRGLRRQRRPRTGRSRVVVLGAVGALTLPVLASAAFADTDESSGYQRPGVTERVSVAFDGIDGNAWSCCIAISADGRYVAFGSKASDLVADDTNDVWDVFVRDRETGTIERVSVASDGTEANIGAGSPVISADGRYVAFVSGASNLVPGDTNANRGDVWVYGGDVFVHDRKTGTTERVSVASDGTEGNASSSRLSPPAISADGRYVAFDSWANNLVPDDTNGAGDHFVHDRETGVTERVSVASDGTEQTDYGSAWSPAISADGRYVAFQSRSSNLVPGDTSGPWRMNTFVHDRETGTTERVSVASDGTEGNDGAGSSGSSPSISADGRYVAFTSRASNLVPGDTNGTGDTFNSLNVISCAPSCNDHFVHDRKTGTTERVSVASDGTEGNGDSSQPSVISGDGRYVAFLSNASNLVPGDTNGTDNPYSGGDIFVHDRKTGTTERVSVASDGTEGAGGQSHLEPAISADGRYVAFTSEASNLVPGDANDAGDVFVRDRGSATGVGALEVQKAPGEVSVSGWATFSGVTVASADDPEDDGEPVGPVSADDMGAEITGASIIYQPEQKGVLLRLRLASLPSVAVGPECLLEPNVTGCKKYGTGGGIPEVVLYRFGFELEGTRYEIRAWREIEDADPPVPVQSHFWLHKCATECTEIAQLSGGIGTTGAEIRVGVPLSALGAKEGAELTGIEASAEREVSPLLAPEVLDDVALPGASIPVSQVQLGIAPPSAREADVPFTTEAELVEGRFTGRLDMASRPPGPYRVWVRACLGDTCKAHTRDIEIGQ